MSAVLIDENGELLLERSIRFDEELRDYGTTGGVHCDKEQNDALRVTAPSLMFVEALDRILSIVQRDESVDLSNIRAISGSAQQHGSVYWAKGAEPLLHNLEQRPDVPLHEQLADAFAIADAPVWMDSSTASECAALEQLLGGPQAVADLSGSRAYERFTASQIVKLSHSPAWASVERVSLISSMLPSLLLGHYATIDMSDGSGMNLMALYEKKWSPALLKATGASGIRQKLGPDPLPSSSVLGHVSAYFSSRFGLAPDCKVMAFSGDNPCTLAGLALSRAGDVAVSLGTSDVLMAVVASPSPSGQEGHVFVNPVDSSTYITMLCYKNGSLARQALRDRCSNGSWREFAEQLEQSEPGNHGTIGFFYIKPEITPKVLHTGVFGFDSRSQLMQVWNEPCVEVRAIVESQCLSMRHHAAGIGVTQPRRLIVTGGASTNKSILRVLSDVFNVPVYTAIVGPNTAAVGAAYRALHADAVQQDASLSFEDVIGSKVQLKLEMLPRPDEAALYDEMLYRFAYLEEQVVEALS